MKKIKPNQFAQAQRRKQQRAAAKLGAVVQAAEREAPVEFLRQFIYFVAYLRLDPRGNQYGNLIVRVPGPLDSNVRLRSMEQAVADQVRGSQPPSPIVGGNDVNVVITCVSDLGSRDVPITAEMREKIKAMEQARAEQAQAAGDAGEDGPHEASELGAPPATEQ